MNEACYTKRFVLWKSRKAPYKNPFLVRSVFAQSLFFVESYTLTLREPSVACSSLDDVLGGILVWIAPPPLNK